MSDVFHTNRRDGPWLITILAVADRRHGNIGYGLSFFLYVFGVLGQYGLDQAAKLDGQLFKIWNQKRMAGSVNK